MCLGVVMLANSLRKKMVFSGSICALVRGKTDLCLWNITLLCFSTVYISRVKTQIHVKHRFEWLHIVLRYRLTLYFSLVSFIQARSWDSSSHTQIITLALTQQWSIMCKVPLFMDRYGFFIYNLYISQCVHQQYTLFHPLCFLIERMEGRRQYREIIVPPIALLDTVHESQCMCIIF